jgi:hypothetical protein
MADEYSNRVILGIIDERLADARAVVPGKVSEVTRDSSGERIVTFAAGIGSRRGATVISDGLQPGRPVLYPGGGGWSVRWPIGEGDEALGLAVDRNPERWELGREVGDAHTRPQPHDVSNVHLLPFTMTAPSGPEELDEDLVISNERGEVMRLGQGALTISTPGPDPLTVATIELTADGNVEITPGSSPTAKVVLGGAALTDALTKWQELDAAITAMLVAGSGAGTGTPGSTGKLAFDAAKIAYDSATGLSSPATAKVVGA